MTVSLTSPPTQYATTNLMLPTGGKAKPLKAPKKEKKELDEDEIAYKAKQAADAKAKKEMAEKAKGKGMSTRNCQALCR